MNNSDLKNVLISAIETADSRLLSMLYAVTKTYQITGTQTSTPVQAAPAPVATATVDAQPRKVDAQSRKYVKDDRPRKVLRIYRKPKDEVVAKKVVAKAVESKPAPPQRIIRLASSASTTPLRPSITRTVVARPTRTVEKEGAVSGVSNNGGFITDLMTKTV